MSGDEFLKVASWLVANSAISGEPEARFRTAISRAYYATFHTAVDVLARFGVAILQNHQGHKDAVFRLRHTKIEYAIQVAGMIDDLRTKRNNADYRLTRPEFQNQRTAMLVVQEANAIIADLKAFLDEPRCSELRAAIDAQK